MSIASEQWLQVAKSILREKGQKVGTYRALVRKRMLESMRLSYWKTIMSFAKDDKHLQVEDIGKALKVAHTTHGRWFKEEIIPGWENIVSMAVLALKAEWKDIGIRNIEVHWAMVSRTLELISEHEVNKKATILIEDYLCLQYFFDTEESGDFARFVEFPDVKIPDEWARTDVFMNIANEMRQLRLSKKFWTPEEVVNVIENWTLPTSLLALGLPEQWWHELE